LLDQEFTTSDFVFEETMTKRQAGDMSLHYLHLGRIYIYIGAEVVSQR